MILTGGWRGYLKCSIRGTNNQLPNIIYKFVHPPLFNIKHKIGNLQVIWRQIFVFWKSCLSQIEENGCLWTYEHASLVSDFKLTQENDNLFFRDINKFSRYRILCKSTLKCGFLTKCIELTRFIFFEILGVPQVWGTWLRPFW